MICRSVCVVSGDLCQDRQCPATIRTAAGRWLMCLCLCLVAGGCGDEGDEGQRANGPAGEARHSDDASGHDDHDEHHPEHFVPEHKPKDFHDLAGQLYDRVQDLAKPPALSVSGDLARTEAIQQFRDIIGWIPELAADSDLQKSDWDAAVALGVELDTLWASHLKSSATGVLDAAAVPEFEAVIDRLKRLAERSQQAGLPFR